MTEAQRAGMAANRAALRLYGGPRMADPTLRGRLAAITLPCWCCGMVRNPNRRPFDDVVHRGRW